MSRLAQKRCSECIDGTRPLKGAAIERFLEEIDKGWEVVDEHRLRRSYYFKDFKQALYFVNKVGSLAEEQAHHPDLFLSWGLVDIFLWTHAIDGLSENDFIMAAKIDKFVAELSE